MVGAIPGHLEELAAAVLASSTDVCKVRHMLLNHGDDSWERELAHVREHMQRELAVGVLERGHCMVHLPRETRRYYDQPLFGPSLHGSEIPIELVEGPYPLSLSEPVPWISMEIELTVQTRELPA